MRTKILAASLTIIMGLGTAGCKTASKMAWWKTVGNGTADSAVMAHSAPALPSDTAKRVESLASTDLNITTEVDGGGGAAAPFVPNVPPTSANPIVASTSPAAYPGTAYPSTAYPSTGYPSTASASGAPVASPQAAVAAHDTSQSLGTVGMPYNPHAVPPAASRGAGTAVAASSPSRDRYAEPIAATAAGFNSAALAAQPAAPFASDGSRYRAATSSSEQEVVATSGEAAPAAGFSENPAANLTANHGTPAPSAPVGSRYENPAPTTGLIPPALVQGGPITPTPTTATAPYRPGGTGDYPQASLELASRPEAPDSNSGYNPQSYRPPAVSAPQPRYR
ncbi:MAG: hypothetical protein MK171_12170 [Pirellulales bacterium]|nr:hypothetical protein [Pirellulales bacterium]